MLHALLACLLVGQTPPPLPDLTPSGRYEMATRNLAASKFEESAAMLDALIAQYPRVPEYFAARAQAQLGLRQYLFATADGQYALALKPELSSALYTVAAAQEALARPALAAQYYRAYAAAPDARPELRAEASRRAETLAPTVAPPPPAAPRSSRAISRNANPNEASCLMGTDGNQACGFHCLMGTDGVSACADSANGVCAMGTNGRVTCSHLGGGGGPAPSKPTECRMGSDGINTCGYNCRMGSNGHFYCASRPDGQCAFNADGTFTCP
jgi:hypothetical protein